MYVVTCISVLFLKNAHCYLEGVKPCLNIKALISFTKETYSKVSLSLSID